MTCSACGEYRRDRLTQKSALGDNGRKGQITNIGSVDMNAWGLNRFHRVLSGGGLLFSAQTVMAAGFYLAELGTPGSLGTAGVANPTNTFTADSSWANPAGMTGVEENEWVAGLQLILPNVRFDSSVAEVAGDDGGNAGLPAGVPSFFLVKKLSDKARFGFSIAGLMGGGIDYGNEFVGRYAVTRAELLGLGISPSFGYQVTDKLSLGAGVSFVYTVFEEDISINQAALGAPDGEMSVKDADDWGYQPYIGLTYAFSDRAVLGVVYRAEMDVDLEGDLSFKNMAGPTPRANSVDVSWDNPQWLDVGFRYHVSDETMVFFNAGWQEWSQFSENVLAIQGGLISPVITLDRNWDDTWYAGVALARKLSDKKGFSLGLSYDSSPVEDNFRTADFPLDETWKFSGSYGWPGKGKLDYAVGATLYLVGDAKLDQTAQGVRFAGDYDKNILFFVGGTIRYVF